VRHGILDEVERATGLPGLWFESMLWISRTEGAAGRMCDVAAHLDVPPSTFTRLVDRMEQAGLVTRTADPRNRRTTLVRLTAVGEARLAEALLIHESSIRAHFTDHLSAEELELLNSVSHRLHAVNSVTLTLTTEGPAR
jgi:DNA-binding MarR family transcriptional regulator